MAETSGFSAGMKQAQRDMAGTEKVSRDLKSGFTALSREGLQLVEQSAPRAAGALGALQGAMAGLLTGGLIGGAIGGTVALASHFQSLAKAAEDTARKIADAQAQSLRSARTAQIEIQQLQATATGDLGKSAEAAHARTIALAQLERDEKVRLAQDTVQNLQQLEITLAAIQRQFAGQRMVADQQLANDRLAIEQKVADERTKAFDKEVAELQKIQDLIRQLSQAAQTAAHDRAIAEGTASGDVFKILDAETAKRYAEIQKTAQNQLDALKARATTEQEFYTASDLIAQTSRDQQLAADLTAIDARKQALATLTTDAKKLFESLGPGFEDLLEKLKVQETVQQSEKDFRTLANALQQDFISATQAADAIRIMTDNLQSQGATIGQIGSVVPATLKAITSLFRDASGSVTTMADSTEAVQTALDALHTPQGLTDLTTGAATAAAAFDALRDAILSAQQAAAASTPATGTGSPGAAAGTPAAAAAQQQALDELARRGGTFQ